MQLLDKKNIEDILALTPVQEGMLFHYLKDPQSQMNIEQLCLGLSGNIEFEHVREAWQSVVNTNEMLRTVFHWEDVKKPVQLVLREYHTVLRYFDLTTGNECLEDIISRDRNEIFDLQDVPFRVTLCKLAEIGAGQYKYGMIVTNHHILYDGWSNGVILEEFFSAYNDLCRAKIPRKPFKTKFKEYLKWLHGQDKREQESFWKKYLGGIEYPAGKETLKRNAISTKKNTGAYRITIPTQQVLKLEELCKKYRISLSSFFYCAWGLLLLQYHRCGDLLFDITVSGRPEHINGVENMVGLFINTLPVRIDTLPGENVLDMLQRINLMMLRWQEYEHTSLLFLKELLAESNKAGSLFDSVLVIENYPLDVKSLLENRELPFSVDSVNNSSMTAYDLTLLITLPGSGSITADFIYDNALFDQHTISLIIGHFESLFNEMVKDLWKPVSAMELPEGEKEALRHRFENIRQSVPEVTYIAPADEVEKKLAAVWAEVLKVDKERIGVQADFFAFGGHSLKASLLATVLHREFNVKVPLAAVFKYPTIAEMSEYIKTMKGSIFVPIQSVEKKDFYPLTSAQKRLYILQQMDLSSSFYNGSFSMEIEGELNINSLSGVFRELIDRHESLRTSFHFRNEEPIQRVWDKVEFTVEQFSLAGGNGKGTASPETIDRLIRQFRRAFDLGKTPLLRVGLIKLENRRHILVVDIHHIISDGFSRDILMKEFASLYSGHQLPPLKLQYRDFLEWKNRQLQSGELKAQEKFLLKQFSGELPILELPYDFPRPTMQSFEGDRVRFLLGKELKAKIESFIKNKGATLFMFLLTAYNILLSRYSGQHDIIVGSPVAGRTHADLENVIGLLIDTIVIRSNPGGEKTFDAYLKEIRESTLLANENQDYPFRELAVQVANENDLTRNPLFTVMLNVLKQDFSIMPLDELKIKPYSVDFKVSWVDLTLEVTETKDDIVIEFEYCTALFKRSTIEMLGKDFIDILKQVRDNPGIRFMDIDILNGAMQGQPHEPGQKQLVPDVNQPASVEAPTVDRLIFQSFEETVEKMPDHIAILQQDQQFTYREVNHKGNCFARLLRGRGLKSEGIAAIMMDRSIEMIIALLGVLKAGGSYLPIDPDYPQNRILFMLKDSGASMLITKETISKGFSFTTLANIRADNSGLKPVVTLPRPQIKDFNRLPIPDRSLVNYEKYHHYIGEALAKHTFTIQATRGCPFKCAFCHKIWPKIHVYRSAENIYCEVKKLYDIGARRFVFVDDIFNLNRENSGRFFKLIIENGLKVQLFFTNGLRGDILTEEFIDLMVEAGTVDFDFSLESASPRIQRLIRKNLDLTRLKKTIDYIAAKHPHVIIELQTMLGFPTETEEEALMTLEYIKSLKWVDFPYVHFLRIFPGTDMEKVALENGVSREVIQRSANLAYHEYAETMPFSKEFAKLYQTRFFNEYFLLKDRFITVLKKQMKLLSESELIQKYDSFFPTEIKSFDALLAIVGISREELGEIEFLPVDYMAVPDVNNKIKTVFPSGENCSGEGSLKILLLDLSQFFSNEADTLYDVVEVPLGLIYLLTYIKEQYGSRVNGKIAKSRIDFDSYEELNSLLNDFKPDIIGIRTLNYYKDFFHKTIALVRQWGIDVPIVAGGPYATTSYRELLNNTGVDIVVLGEGEMTFAELVGEILENNRQLPDEDRLNGIKGVAYISHQQKQLENGANRQIIFMDKIVSQLADKEDENLESVNKPSDLVYTVYTSGSTGKPKGVMVEHQNVAAYLEAFSRTVTITPFNTVIQQASFSFDTYLEEVFPFLLKGGKIALPGKYDVLDTILLRNFIARYRVDTIDCSPLLLNQLNRLTLPGHLKTFISGGDVLRREYIENLLQIGDVYNSYGPTETTVCATFFHCHRESDSDVPIGFPLPGYQVVILGINNRWLPPGIPGELCISGRGVTRGYLNRIELTVEKFVVNPFSPDQKMYRTGDLATRLTDGSLKFVGRIDHQVKIRGFRIELEEIERKLLKHNEIREAVAVVKESESTGKYICVYFEADKEMNVKELRHLLSAELPGFMIPAGFVQLEKIPLTPTGKINRELLKQVEKNTIGLGGDYVAPETDTEKQMVSIWQEVFEGRKIGIYDHFFELGGDSLLAIRTIARIRNEMHLEISLKTLFEHPTIRALAGETIVNKREIPIIEKVSRNSHIPLSFSQERLWFLQELDAGNAAYFVPRVIRIMGNLHVTLMERTFTEMIRRHEILRTVFIVDNGEVEQQILQPFYFNIPVRDWSGFGKEEQEQRVSRFIEEEGRLPFDFQRGPLLRVSLLKLKEREHLFVLTEHHLIHDGWTQGVLLNEFIAIFSAYAEGREHGLPELPIQYADYAVWQRNLLKGEVLEQHLAYWKEKLSGLPPVLELPVDRPRPAIISGNGDLKVLTIPPSLATSLKKFSKEQGATLFMTMMAVFKVFLYRYSGVEDLCVGIGIANRRLEEMEGMLGMVINTLPLRTQAPGEISFKRYLQLEKDTCLGAYQHEDTPFGKIVEMMQPERSLSYSPLFQVLFTFMDTPGGELRLPGLELELLPIHNRSAKFDINVVVVPPPEHETEDSGEILVEWEYNTDIFDLPTVERMVSHYSRLLAEGMTQPETSIATLPMLSDAEMRQVLNEFNDTEAVYPQEKTIHQLFEEQVEGTPDRIAVVGHGQTRTGTDKNMFISYRQLNQQSDHLAAVLIEKGVLADSIVGIMMDRSVELISGILGILKAGGAYMPIDPEYPRERIEYMLKDSGARLLVSANDREGEKVRRWEGEKVLLEEISQSSKNSSYPLTFLPSDLLSSSNLAYIIYTSGTTGKPKGALIEHRNVVRLLYNDKFQFDFTDGDIWTIFHSFCFDFSVWEMYGALLRGGKAIIIPKMTARDTAEFLGLLARESVTVLNQTPSAFYNLINEALNNTQVGKKLYLRYVIFGGEALTPLKLKNWRESFPKTKLINMFGITETTVHVTYKEIRNKNIELNISNIGVPIPTLGVYILDRFLKPVPVGVPGEICVGGKGVGRGYLNRVELTTGKFIENPFQPGDRLYRSGDMGRFFENGEMEYLGRIDHQVKIRGFRIELEEIRSQLLRYGEIKEAVVITGEAAGEKYLCAYIVSDAEPSITGLRTYLSGKLPDYMIPSYFVRLERLPLTSNGKVDRNALPDVHGNREITQEYTSPSSETEKRLTEIWENILGVNIGTNEEFFHSGGDSIKAVRLINLINTEFSAHLKIADIYLKGTIKKLAAVIESEKTVPGYENDELERALTEIEALKNRVMADERLPKEIEDMYPMSDIQEGMVFHSLKDTQTALYHDQMVYQARISGFNAALFKKAFILSVDKHAILRTVFDLDTYGEPVQLVYRSVPYDITHNDISALEKSRQEEYLTRFLEEDRENVFQFAIPPLWRLRTFALGNDNICVVLVAHHAILDGWSVASLVTETINTYWQLKANPAFVPGMLKNSYKAFIIEQMVEKHRVDSVDFWRKELDGFKRLELQNPLPDNAKENIVKKYNFKLGVELLSKLKDISKAYHTTVKNLCFGAYLYMLNMLCYENDMVVGLVTNNRPICPDGDKILGCFLNTIPVRLTIPTHVNWLDYIDLVEKKLLELKPYERLPLFDIVRVIGEDTQDRNPIFDVIFNFVDFHVLGQIEQDYGKDDVGKLNVEGNIITNTLFNFNVSTTLEEFGVFISYSESLVGEETVISLCRYFEGILNNYTVEPRGMVNKVELMPVEERKKLLEEFNDTNTEYPVDKTIHGLFAEQVERIPDSIALVGANRHPRVCPNCLTYRELNEQSGRLANVLIEKGVLAGNIVGIMIERSIEMMIGIMGILKSGGAYLPIDPEYPRERIDYMLKDSGAKIMIERAEEQKSGRAEFTFSCFFPASPLPRFLASDSSNVAYIIYTSGSTGRPKGVMIEHRSVVNLLFALQNEYPFSTADTYLLKTSYIFDVSVTELFGWAMGGGRLAILEKHGEKDPAVIFDWVEGCQVTHINFVPSMFNEFIEHAAGEDKNRLSSLKYIFLAGEVLLPRMVERFRALNVPAQLENIYGPTESTVYASKYSLCDWHGNGSIQIGKPLPNISLYIINKGGQWQPLGAAGELCITGVGLARGYLNNPELTNQKFLEVQEPFFKKVPGLFYRTGDLARWLPDGNIEFLGRIDQQVKIRGYRIELGEIENHLSKYNGIKEAVVVVKEADSGDKNLAAYIVSDIEVSTAALRDYLANRLPGYMIPAYFIRLEKMPLTPSGKIDRRALPEPVLMTGKEYEGPRNEIEKKLVELWSEILARNPMHASQLQTSLGIDDNFFQLGGHSLKATSLASRIYKVFGVKIQLGEIFKRPTIRGLFDYIDRAEREQYIRIEPTETKEYYELSPAQKSLFTLQQLHRESTSYNMPVIMRLERGLDKEKLEQVFQQLMKRHESLRTSFELINETPIQRVHPGILFELKHMELAGDGMPDRSVVENIINSVIRPFDLSRPPLFRVCMITAADLRLLVVDMHHIISDGISNMVLEKEFRVLCDGKDLPPIRLQYKDYVEWRNGKARQLKLRQQEMYWLSEFSQEPPGLNLPTNYPRPAEKNFAGSTIGFALTAPEILLLKEIAGDTESTLSIVTFWLFAILLSRLSGQDDIVIGVPASGRPHPDLERIIGVFINTIPIRLSIDDTQPVMEFLAHVKQKCLRAFENQDYPFEELVEKVSPERETNRNPLFDAMLNYMNHTESLANVSDHFSKEQYNYQRSSSKFDFSVDVHEYRDSLYLRFEYSTQLFKADTIERFLDCFRQIVSSILMNQEIKLQEIEFGHEYSELENNVFSAAPVDFDSMFSMKEEKTIMIGVKNDETCIL